MLQSIIGQEYAIAVLQGALANDHLPGTYLFVGPAHIGKSLAAIELAKAINCLNPPATGECCDTCRSCRAIDAGTHPDVRTVAPVGPSRTLRIPQFWPREGVKEHPADRAMLRDLQYAPVSAKRRVFIVEDAEAMGEDTANSLLKVLEEPPRYALFILTAPSTGAVLPTIASRSLAIRFRFVPTPLIESALSEKNLSTDRGRFLAAYSQGRIGRAITLSEQPALLSGRDALLDIAEKLTAMPPRIAAFRIAEELRKAASKLGADQKEDGVEEKSQRTNLSRALDILMLWYGDLLAVATSGPGASLVNTDRSIAIVAASGRHGQEDIERSLRLLLDTRRYIERNANAQIALETLVTQLLTIPYERRAAA
jgi:DNA polymerase-3 subunit delta'